QNNGRLHNNCINRLLCKNTGTQSCQRVFICKCRYTRKSCPQFSKTTFRRCPQRAIHGQSLCSFSGKTSGSCVSRIHCLCFIRKSPHLTDIISYTSISRCVRKALYSRMVSIQPRGSPKATAKSSSLCSG